MCEYAGLGLGAVAGTATLLLLHGVVWTSIAGPLQEWFEERFVDPRRHRKSEPGTSEPGTSDAPAEKSSRPIGVVISDLHVDGWDLARLKQFITFLNALQKCNHIQHVFLNGDFADLPLHPLLAGRDEPHNYRFELGTWQPSQTYHGVWPPESGAIVKLLVGAKRKLAGKNVHYLTGNHDIGISGARFFRLDLSDLPAQSLWNPGALIRIRDSENGGKARAIYLEHGQAYDPFLWLYLRYQFLDVMRHGQNRRDRSWIQGMQRNGKNGMRSTERSNHSQPGFFEYLTMLRFRHGARRARNRWRRIEPDLEIAAIVFGHTHLPDTCEFPPESADVEKFGLSGCRYVNSGSWANDKSDPNFCLIYDDCTLSGPHFWPRDQHYLDPNLPAKTARN